MFGGGIGLEDLKGHETATAVLCGGLDPDSIPLTDIPAAYESLAHMERLVSGAKLRLSRRVDESWEWQRRGYRNPAEYVAATDGVSEGQARNELEASQRMAGLPGTEDAVRRGELSPTQTRMITDGASADPAAESTLLEKARTGTVRDLRDEVARTKSRADGGAEATQRRLRHERYLRTWHDLEGAFNLAGRSCLDDGATIASLLNPVIDQLFHHARREGRREDREAYAFDALIELLRRGAGYEPRQPVPDTEPDRTPTDRRTPAADLEAAVAAARHRQPSLTHLSILRIDLEALVRGWVDGEETCEIAGLGPVPVSVARRLLGESVLKLVITHGTDVLNVTNLGRGPNAAQKIALLWACPDCTAEGCDRPPVEYDHRTPWPDCLCTDLTNLDGHCGHHHDLKTYEGWALVFGTGRRPMVPPDDPRHPANAPPPVVPDDGDNPSLFDQNTDAA